GKGQVFFTNSGTESTEAAMKLARYRTGRPYYLAFMGGFHGRSMGALSLTASKSIHRKGFAPLIPGVLHAPYPNQYRPPGDVKPDECDLYVLHYIRDVLFRHLVDPEEVAAIFVEPIQGEGGYVVPPKRFLSRLSELAKEFGILFVVDEIQTGMGRTGKMFAFEHFNAAPDIMILAKGLASGMPLGAMITRTDLMSWASGAHANTFGGNPIACEASLATIELLEKGLIANAARVGDYLISRLQRMQTHHRLMGDVRGKGLMIGIELVRDRVTKEMAIPERNAVIDRCFKKGLLVLGCGQNVLRLMPPLVITQSEADTALAVLDEALTEVERR
ncbi:MAG TPA: aminotransferase class III-fold pyridoxal phosphate-dependent enzyme, partial [Nitrospiria bacterium]|nr:aminotransferase class III-fold pyridoxal phosphate-dependent enzyme [Nitrospiria bacterium]